MGWEHGGGQSLWVGWESRHARIVACDPLWHLALSLGMVAYFCLECCFVLGAGVSLQYMVNNVVVDHDVIGVASLLGASGVYEWVGIG